MGVDYGCEKFYSAFNYVIVSNGSLQDRLEAVISGVSHLQRDSFPDDEMWNRFQELLSATTKLPARTPSEGTISATTAQMTEDEARKWLQEALFIFAGLHEAYGKGNGQTLSDSDSTLN